MIMAQLGRPLNRQSSFNELLPSVGGRSRYRLIWNLALWVKWLSLPVVARGIGRAISTYYWNLVVRLSLRRGLKKVCFLLQTDPAA